MSDEKREAQDRVEAWHRCLRIVQAWTDSTRAIGSKELRQVMGLATEEALRQYNRALAESREMDRSAE